MIQGFKQSATRNQRYLTISAALCTIGLLAGCSTSGKQSPPMPANASATNATNNTTTANATSAASSSAQPITSIQQYTNQTLTPAHAIPIVAPNLPQNGVGHAVPVVRVPVSAAVEFTVTMHPPATVNAAVTAADAKQLAAYLVPVNQYTWFYILGPRGMGGKAELAADGSAAIHLSGAGSNISLSLSGGSPIMAASLSAPFFASAHASLVSEGMTKAAQQNGISHTSVQYQDNRHVAEFAFQSTTGQSVYGYNDYHSSAAGMGPFDQASLFTYAAGKSAASLAPAVMASAQATLRDIGDPSLTGSPIPSHLATTSVGGQTVQLETPSLPSFKPQAVATSHGVVWVSEPQFVAAHLNQPHGLIPTGPYFIQVTPHASSTTTPLNKLPSQTLATIPAYQLGVSANNPWYNYLQLAGTAGADWVLYTVAGAAPDMNNAATSALFAVNAAHPGSTPTRITAYMDGGGGFFLVGHSGSTVVYDVANDLNPNGNMTNNLSMIDLTTGKRTSIPSTALKDGIVTVTIDGITQHVHLKEM